MQSSVHPMRGKVSWQASLAQMITDPAELWRELGLDPALLDKAYAVAAYFPLKVTRSFVSRMNKGDINDPLLRQILPLAAELETTAGYEKDPLQEAQGNPVPGLLHKYAGRVLITFSGACAVHCRYCFRRHFPYTENTPGRPGFEKLLAYIAEDNSIQEVILSGGDPLIVSDRFLQEFVEKLILIAHVKRLRFHTRIPIVLPERITPDFISWLRDLPLQKVMVIHCNHAQEIDHEVRAALALLQSANMALFNQSVLLRGVNDAVPTLVALSEALFASGVTPYYLHVPDKVQGTAHFDLPFAEAKALHQGMQQHLPGYLVPRLVREEPGAPAKTLL